jgi:hypothetical protein
MDPHDELAAHYAIARSENPDADIEEIATLVAERMSIDGETALASVSLFTGGDVDVVRAVRLRHRVGKRVRVGPGAVAEA